MSELITDEIVEMVAKALWNCPAFGTPTYTWDELEDGNREPWRADARAALDDAAPLIAARALEGMRTEVATWHVYETRDIGDAYRADAIVDLIQGRLDGLAKEGRP